MRVSAPGGMSYFNLKTPVCRYRPRRGCGARPTGFLRSAVDLSRSGGCDIGCSVTHHPTPSEEECHCTEYVLRGDPPCPLEESGVEPARGLIWIGLKDLRLHLLQTEWAPQPLIGLGRDNSLANLLVEMLVEWVSLIIHSMFSDPIRVLHCRSIFLEGFAYMVTC